jgi:hypothetical protein
VFAQNYGEAGSLEYYASKYPLPPVLSLHNNYWYWGPGPEGGTMIIIGGELEDHLKVFKTVQEVARTSCEYCMPYEQNLPVFVARDWRVALADVWRRERVFI